MTRLDTESGSKPRIRFHSLTEWKTWATAKLVEIAGRSPGNDAAIESLIIEIRACKKNTLRAVIHKIYVVSKTMPEVLEILPTPEEVEEITRGGRR